MGTFEGDFRSKLREVSSGAAFNNWLGLEVDEAREGEVELSLPWRREFGQYNGYLHASIVSGLIDTACGFAASTLSGRVLASQLSVRFLRPAVAEVFIVRGRVIKPGRQQVFACGEIFARGAPEKLLAVGDAILVPIG
ncbi:MAG: PaaI family thioesterase [Parvibaculaceae bacterium]|nr:PaaI family thioesterase [Parvibaculaceae bacterium]